MTALDRLVAGGTVTAAAQLAGLTTYKFGGPARWFADVGSMEELTSLLTAWRADGRPPALVVGRGSNLVVSDAGFEGLVIRLAGEFAEMVISSDGIVTAGAAVPLPKLARTTVKAGRGGLEWFIGIPGSVGGAVCMNAGGHGSDTREWIIDAEILAWSTGEVKTWGRDDLDLSYRHSAVSDDDLVLSARFRTVSRSPEEGEEMLREITQWRRLHQPGGTYNAGSVFKNPPGDAAGRIIDSLGLKGFTIGGASVSERHANFFEASHEASAQDVYDLVVAIQRRVREETGVELVPEVRFAGSFDPAPAVEGR
ncbi:MAG: UDP-N-acetylmuramate dehydrogenase [Acidimicrobiia bacterium]|nr:UDP-N-acetylmuramate dehydrogenase [Acidimicrobiia bacterium]